MFGGAVGSSEAPVALLRQLDLLALALALPIFLAARLPLAGYAAAAVGWLAQWAIRTVLERRAAAADQPRTAIALTGIGMLVRPWVVALTILLVGVRDEDAGLAATVLCALLFTVHLGVTLLVRAIDAAGSSRR